MRLFIFLAGAAMAASYFVVWIEPPFAAPEISPAALIGTEVEQLQRVLTDGPWQRWVFMGGFALAALSALTAALGRAWGFLCLFAGLSPAILGVHFYSRADQLRADLNLPFEVDFQNAEQAYDLLSDFIRAGLWMYLGGAIVLLLAGLVMSMSTR